MSKVVQNGREDMCVDTMGKVAVLMGGMSAEREISLQSGRAVLDALKRKGIDAIGVDVDDSVAQVLMKGGFSRAFNMLHGRGGEDGTMQGLLEVMNIPFTGSGVMASALAMDKLRTKQVWMASGLPTPLYAELESEADCEKAIQAIGLPLIIKPVLEGSSIGMSKVEDKNEIVPAMEIAKQCGGAVIAEEWIDGKEYTAAILNDKVLPMIRLETPNKFYDFEAKYQSAETQYTCPCGLGVEDEALFGSLVLKAFRAVGACGWGRVDFMVDDEGQPWLIEVNTVPGMTSHSLVPMAAKQAGISFDELVLKILETSAAGKCV